MKVPAISTPPPLFQLLSDGVRWQIVSALAHSDRHVGELVRLVDRPANLVSYHLGRLRAQQLVRERRSTADARDVYYSLDLDRLRTLYTATGDALHPGLTLPEQDQPGRITGRRPPVCVLFLCTENSARSQMAEGLMRHLGGESVEVVSAGSAPSRVHPDAIRTMAGLGIDISHQRCTHLDEYRGERFDYIITVCDRVREVCPVFADDPERIHWSFADPAAVEGAEERRWAFDRTSQQLMTRIRYLLTLIERERTTAT